MALHEKKNILRGMYTATPAETGEAGASEGAGKAVPLDVQIERKLRPVMVGMLFLPVVLCLVAMGWMLLSSYRTGMALRVSMEVPRVVQESFILLGVTVLLGTVSILLSFGMRDQTSRWVRWTVFWLSIGMLPLAVGTVVCSPVLFNYGTEVGYRQLDWVTLRKEAAEIHALFPATGVTVNTISDYDADYAKLPPYTRTKLRPRSVSVYARGLALDMRTGVMHSGRSGICLPGAMGDKVSPAEMGRLTGSGMEVQSESQQGLRYEDQVGDFQELMDGTP